MRQLGSLVHNESTEMLSSIYDTCPNDSETVLILVYFVTLLDPPVVPPWEREKSLDPILLEDPRIHKKNNTLLHAKWLCSFHVASSLCTNHYGFSRSEPPQIGDFRTVTALLRTQPNCLRSLLGGLHIKVQASVLYFHISVSFRVWPQVFQDKELTNLI
jgi:hypothetical protein